MRLALAAFALAAPLAAWSQPLPERSEPKVEHIVVEDRGARIEELRVRGQTQRIVVRPKSVDFAPYEIVVPDNARDLSAGPAPTRGASGQRVWNVLTF